jgi:hypothetical protein
MRSRAALKTVVAASVDDCGAKLLLGIRRRCCPRTGLATAARRTSEMMRILRGS